MTNTITGIDTILRWSDIKKVTGLGRTTVHSMVRQGKFPKPIKLSENGRASGWISSEVQKWLDSRLAARDKNKLAA